MMARPHIATAQEDTIAAIATPPGISGIAVIRVSGANAIPCTAEAFDGAHNLLDVPSHTLHYGAIRDEDGALLDEVVISVFRTPHSYTGEDCVEVSCHGGPAVTRSILRRLLATGIRHALPGEFTKRAFLNGRIDLVQSEAVADLIHAQSEDARRASVAQLRGAFSTYVRSIRDQLLHCASLLELNLDFAEEDVDLMPVHKLKTELETAETRMEQALLTHRAGRIIREGVKVVLAGEPNVGKSSLLNRLLGASRAIVTDIPGTTRDYLEEPAMVNGEVFRFVDTAGLRETRDTIEREGIRFSEQHLVSADIICYIADASRDEASTAFVQDIRTRFQRLDKTASHLVILFNKVDLLEVEAKDNIRTLGEGIIPISALTGEGLDECTAWLASTARHISHPMEAGQVLVTNARHADCLRRGIEAVQRAQQAVNRGRTEEFIAFEIRGAIDAMGEIIGEVTTDDVLNNIFSRFCIGK